MKKKLLAVMLVVVMVLGSFSTVFAAGDKSITLTNGKAGHTYTLYQILVGTVNAEKPLQLDDIQWGDGVNDAFKTSKGTAAAYAKDIADKNDARATAQELVKAGALQNGVEKTLSADGEVVFDNLDAGYYIITDDNGNDEAVEGDFSSEYIVQVLGTESMSLKGSPTTSEKKVLDNKDKDLKLDVSDLKNVDGTWEDSADHDFNDPVPFKLTATLANNVQSYAKYHVIFEDTMDTGLTPPTAWYVNVLGLDFNITDEAPTATKEKGDTKVTVTKTGSGQSFAIRVDLEQKEPTVVDNVITSNLKDGNNAVVTVKYTAVLNSNAQIGQVGNKNELVCKYSNNPEDRTGNEEGKTPKDVVKVFTFKVETDKVDEQGTALVGATFELYKEVADDTYPTGAEIKEGFADGVKATKLADAKHYKKVDTATVTPGSNFEFKGIDDGTYVLVETVIPKGYNAIEAYEFTVEAEHDATSDNPQLTDLTATTPFKASLAGGNITTEKGNTHAAESGEVYAEIVNNSGSVLPETGGIGTTILYTLGGILVVGAGVLLVARRKMER